MRTVVANDELVQVVVSADLLKVPAYSTLSLIVAFIVTLWLRFSSPNWYPYSNLHSDLNPKP